MEIKTKEEAIEPSKSQFTKRTIILIIILIMLVIIDITAIVMAPISCIYLCYACGYGICPVISIMAGCISGVLTDYIGGKIPKLNDLVTNKILPSLQRFVEKIKNGFKFVSCQKCGNSIRFSNPFCTQCGQVNYSGYKRLNLYIILISVVIISVAACSVGLILNTIFKGYGGYIIRVFLIGVPGFIMIIGFLAILKKIIRQRKTLKQLINAAMS